MSEKAKLHKLPSHLDNVALPEFPGSPSKELSGVDMPRVPQGKVVRSWKKFNTIEDWKREFDSHPEWRGRSPGEMLRDEDSGASAFYKRFRKWESREAKGDRFLRQRLAEQIFPLLQKDWSDFKSIEDWKKEFDSHPEWKGRSTDQAKQDKISGLNAYYQAFYKWTHREAKGDKTLRKKLMKQVFPQRQKDWSSFKSIEDWKKEFDSHPEWRDRLRNEMLRDRDSGTPALYQAFNKWTHREAKGDKTLRKKLMKQVFPQHQKDWSSLQSIEDWQREFDLHPEWQDRSTVQMQRDKDSGALAFGAAFKVWASREAKGNMGLCAAIASRLLPYKLRVQSLKKISSLFHYISLSPDAKTFQDILSSLPPNPDNQNLSQVIRIENEEFKVYHVMFNNAGKIEGRWMVRSADTMKLVKAFGGSIPDTAPRDDASVLSVLED